MSDLHGPQPLELTRWVRHEDDLRAAFDELWQTLLAQLDTTHLVRLTIVEEANGYLISGYYGGTPEGELAFERGFRPPAQPPELTQAERDALPLVAPRDEEDGHERAELCEAPSVE